MYYSEDLIEDVRMKNDIVDVISSYVKLTKKGSSHFGLCPFHNEKSPSFSVSAQKQMYYCFGCGEGGNVITFIMKYENYTFGEALKYLADRVGVELPEMEYSKEAKEKADLRNTMLEINNETGKYYHYLLKNSNDEYAYEYLKNRGLTDEIITKFGLGYSGKTGSLYKYLKNKQYKDSILKEIGLFTFEERGVKDKFWNRVIFPIMDVNNRVVGFGGRVMGDAKPKYLNSPETKLFDKSRNLYGLNYARVSRKSNVLICEGYMDVIALHQAGFTNAVAALGTSFTSGHASLIKRYVSEVVLTFDSDAAGVKATLRAIPILKSVGLSVRVIDIMPYKDPDDFIKELGVEEYQKRIDNAQNSFLYEITSIEKQFNRNDPEEKTKFYNIVAQRLLEFKDELERFNYIEAVSNEFVIPMDLLKSSVGKKALYHTPKANEERPSRQRERNAKKDDGVKQSQKILLTWLIEDVALYDKIKPYISQDDFIEPIYHKVSSLLFEQLRKREVNPAKIINAFWDEEEHKEVAALFNQSLNEGLSLSEKEKVLNETIKNVKKNRLDYVSGNVTDISELQNIIEEQAKLQKMNIKLN